MRFLDLGSFNVQRQVPARVGVPSILELLRHLDVLALQEADELRDELREELPPRWRMTRGARPILYRADLLHLDSVMHFKAAEGRRVGHLPGRRSVLPDYQVTRARFTGHPVNPFVPRRLTLVNVHAPAHNRWGGPRAAMWREFEASVAVMLRAEHRVFGGPAVALGDWNRPMPAGRFPALRDVGATSSWAGRRNPPATHGGDTIDGGWVLGGLFVGATVPGHVRRVGDHRPVTVRLRAHPGPAVKRE